MSSTAQQETMREAGGETIILRAAVIALRDYLEGARRSVDAEIRTYPTPIPRCDAQFNSLYDERARLSAELARIEAALAELSPEGTLTSAVAELTGGPPSGDSAEQALRSGLRAALSQLPEVAQRLR